MVTISHTDFAEFL